MTLDDIFIHGDPRGPAMLLLLGGMVFSLGTQFLVTSYNEHQERMMSDPIYRQQYIAEHEKPIKEIDYILKKLLDEQQVFPIR